MKTRDLEAAQAALIAYQRGTALAERYDPKALRQNEVALQFDRMAAAAARAYWYLTGKHPTPDTSLAELSTENPAEWTKSVVSMEYRL
jgi:hypothetical protein